MTFMALLFCGLAAGLGLYIYDQLVAGPEWARTLLSLALALAPAWYLERSTSAVLLATAAALVANLVVAVLQLLQVQRDAAMTSVLRRR